MTTSKTERLEILSLAREFALGELRPHAMAWDAERRMDDGILAKLSELGFLGMRVPEEYGGLGFDAETYLGVLEELAFGDAAVALSVAIHNGPVCGTLLRHGTRQQKERWLPALAAGDHLGAFALSEPEAGSDAGALSAEASPHEGGWLVSGTKRWVTNGGKAGLVLVFARAPEGVSTFLVRPHQPGYRVTATEKTMGLRASETATVELDGVRVEGEDLLGEAGHGFRYALEALDVGRIGIAAQAVGIGRAAMEHALQYALERHQFGRALAEFGATQAKLAEMHRRILGARALALQAGKSLDEAEAGGEGRKGPEGVTALAAVAKLFASEAATWIADEAIQIFGGYGYMRDYPVEKLLRDAKGTEIYEGTNEIMRHVIAREILRASRGG